MRFAETQFTDWRIVVILMVALSALLIWRRAPRLPTYVAMVLLLASFFECRLLTVVDEEGVHVRFGLLPVYSRSIPLAEIASVAVVPVSASSGTATGASSGANSGAGSAAGSWGWGPHWDRDGTFAMTIRGSQGVLLTLHDGSRLRLGSQEPDALEYALRRCPTAAPCAHCPASAC
jgi:hypothetical protein